MLIIEVFSPSTEREDRGRKKFDYFATPSIRQYAIIEQDERRIDLYTRAGASWTDEIVEATAVLKLSSIGVEVSLDAIYEDTELDATRQREGEPTSSGGVNARSCCSDGTMRRASAIRAASIARADDADAFSAIGEHLAPRIDDQRVAIAAPPAGVLAPLRRREDEAAVLDRPGAQQHMPMRACRSAP